MLLTNSICGDLVTIFLTLVTVLTLYFKWCHQYWEKLNLPSLPPSIPFGTSLGPKGHFGLRMKHIYDKMRQKGWKHGGIYLMQRPFYVVVDLDYVKNIMTKDFHHFSDRGIFHNEKADPLSAHLFNISGPKWRNLRSKLTPTFTSGKMKLMFQTLLDCEVNLRKQVEQHYEAKKPIDIKEVLGCFTTDIIGSCAFGLDCNSFKEENSPFRVYGRRVFDRSGFIRTLKRTFASNFPNLAKLVNIALVPRDISDFFINIVKDTVEYREKNKIVRNDFLQLLLDLKTEESGNDGTALTFEEIAAQSFVFFIAGFETSSTTMAFALYELARHQDIQDQVRDEIESVLKKYDGKITYEAIQEMSFLGQVIDEALRMYPPGPLVPRRCVKDYKVPNTDVVIEKGVMVLIPILGIHYDEKYYPDPEKFDPERFSEENKALRHSYAHIPFGEGPRICIGLRFGLMQSKVGLVSLLRNFKFTVNEKTQEPLKMKTNSLVLAVEGEIWLNVHRL
ncbi:cytochrome P450 6a2 [Tribolium castaneum]|uniref:Cytochrome P450 6BK11 n=1 Tax=Tribolium castaneum TaxID=7070 RepID=D2A5V4_TRICA|nr:PREDICTED: cytochrome P450 6a2 [Tribolium castaneum]EFA05683.1 cytochrome P450 6BK11 [Tribolium castaneum]|eukprot:XP_968370.1 PREDICTED: cytochrome P450 6a2 [Tribolium castaneum]